MAEILADGRVKSDKGIETPQEGAWYDGQQYWGGTLSQKNQINSLSNQKGAGEQVGAEVRAQSAAQQGVSAQQFDEYLFGKKKQTQASSSGGGGSTTKGGGGGSSLSGGVSAGATGADYNVTKEYDKLYKDLGIDALKSEVQAKQAEITARRERLAEASGVINENPFYAEATRTGKLRRLEEQAQADIENLAREQALSQANIDEANQQLATKTNLSTQQYQIDRQATADSVAELNTLLQSGADMSNINIGDFAARTGMSVDTISALVAASQAAEIKPTVIQSTDDSGNVTVTVVDQNTGAIVGQTSLGRIGNAQNNSPSKATEDEINRYYTETLRDYVGTGVGVRDVFANFQGLIDPNKIIQIYNAASPNGPAKESVAELSQLGVTSYTGQE